MTHWQNEKMFKVCSPLLMYFSIHKETVMLRLTSFLVMLPYSSCLRLGGLVRSLFRQSSLLCSFRECYENSSDNRVP